ncbi:MAG: hypothetical protein ACO1OB_00710 [Archangium sp.]
MSRLVKTVGPWVLAVSALVSLPVLAFVVDDELAQQRRARCEALRGVNERTVDERFGTPRKTTTHSREYAFGLDWSLIAHFEGGQLRSCDVSGS